MLWATKVSRRGGKDKSRQSFFACAIFSTSIDFLVLAFVNESPGERQTLARCVRDEIELAQKVNDMQIRIQLDRQ